jgi:hypothetical protein
VTASENTARSGSSHDPASVAVDAAAHTALAETDGVGVGRIDGEASRAASSQGELDRPRLARFVESGEAVAGCGVQARHELS